MVDLATIGSWGSRAEPEVPVESLGNGIRVRGTIDAVGPGMSRMPDMHLGNFAEETGLNHFEAPAKAFRRTPLISGLGGQLGPALRRAFQSPAFGDGMRERLLAIDVL